MQFQLGTMLFQIVVVILLIALMARFVTRPLLAMMKERQDYIDQQIATAEKNREDAEKLTAQQQEELIKARQEAKDLLERAKAQKEREAERIIRQAQERAEQIISEATAQIALEKEKALADLRDEVGLLSVRIAAKMLEKELDPEEQSQLVGRYLKQVGELQ